MALSAIEEALRRDEQGAVFDDDPPALIGEEDGQDEQADGPLGYEVELELQHAQQGVVINAGQLEGDDLAHRHPGAHAAVPVPILRRVGHVQQGTHLLDAFTLTVEVEYSNRQYRPMQDVYDPFLLVRLETTVIAVSGVDAVYTFPARPTPLGPEMGRPMSPTPVLEADHE